MALPDSKSALKVNANSTIGKGLPERYQQSTGKPKDGKVASEFFEIRVRRHEGGTLEFGQRRSKTIYVGNFVASLEFRGF
jgi:hypothetical protein